MAVLPKSKFYNSCKTTNNIQMKDLIDSTVFKDAQDYATETKCGITFLATDLSSYRNEAGPTTNNPRAIQPHQLPSLSVLDINTNLQAEAVHGTSVFGSGLSVEKTYLEFVSGKYRTSYLVQNLHTFTGSTSIDIVQDNDDYTFSVNEDFLGKVRLGDAYDLLALLCGPGIAKDPFDDVLIFNGENGTCTILGNNNGVVSYNLLYDNTYLSVTGDNELTLLDGVNYVKTTGDYTLAGDINFTNPITVGVATTSGHALTKGAFDSWLLDDFSLYTTGIAADILALENEDIAINAIITGYETSFETDSLTVNDFAAIGAGAPSIAYKRLTGTSSNLEGGSTVVPHGLDETKFLNISVLLDNGGTLVLPNDTNTGLQYSISTDGTNIEVYNHGTNSESILSKNFVILITYSDTASF